MLTYHFQTPLSTHFERILFYSDNTAFIATLKLKNFSTYIANLPYTRYGITYPQKQFSI